MFEDFKLIFNNQLEGDPAESSFLKLKHNVSSYFGLIDRNKNTLPQYAIKMCQVGFHRPQLNCLIKQKRAKKITGTFLDNINWTTDQHTGGKP